VRALSVCVLKTVIKVAISLVLFISQYFYEGGESDVLMDIV